MKLNRIPIRLERSIIITPASDYSMLKKAIDFGADAICFDLEDGVTFSEKEKSRINVIKAFKEFKFGNSIRMFRINSLDTKYAYKDLIEVIEAIGRNIDLVVVPKVNCAEDIYVIDTLLSEIELNKNIKKHIGIEALIETAIGNLNVGKIAASSTRLEALIYGSGDFAASVKMPLDAIGEFDDNDRVYPGHRWHYSMQQVVIAARAYGKRCIDGPYAGFNDIKGFKKACNIARVIGFEGKWTIHPNQIKLTNRIFLYTNKQIIWAKAVINSYENAVKIGKGISQLNGKMIDIASVRVARNILDKYKPLQHSSC